MKPCTLHKLDETSSTPIITPDQYARLLFNLTFYGLFLAIFLVRMGLNGNNLILRSGENVESALNLTRNAFFQVNLTNNTDTSSSEDEEQTVLRLRR